MSGKSFWHSDKAVLFNPVNQYTSSWHLFSYIFLDKIEILFRLDYKNAPSSITKTHPRSFSTAKKTRWPRLSGSTNYEKMFFVHCARRKKQDPPAISLFLYTYISSPVTTGIYSDKSSQSRNCGNPLVPLLKKRPTEGETPAKKTSTRYPRGKKYTPPNE